MCMWLYCESIGRSLFFLFTRFSKTTAWFIIIIIKLINRWFIFYCFLKGLKFSSRHLWAPTWSFLIFFFFVYLCLHKCCNHFSLLRYNEDKMPFFFLSFMLLIYIVWHINIVHLCVNEWASEWVSVCMRLRRCQCATFHTFHQFYPNGCLHGKHLTHHKQISTPNKIRLVKISLVSDVRPMRCTFLFARKIRHLN